MLKKNMGMLLVVLLCVIGASFLVFRRSSSAGDETEEISSEIAAFQEEAARIDSENSAAASEKMMNSVPADGVVVEIGFSEDCSMELLGMDVEELNALKTYKMTLPSDQEAYMELVSEVLLGEQDGVEKEIGDDSVLGHQGVGGSVTYVSTDGSNITGSLATLAYRRVGGSEASGSGEDTDYESLALSYMDALQMGFLGNDDITVLVEEDASSAGKYNIQYSFCGVPLSSVNDYVGDGSDSAGYEDYGFNSFNYFSFADGVLVRACLMPTRTVYESELISRQYASLEEISTLVQEGFASYVLSLELNRYYNYYEITGVRCAYVMGFSQQLSDNGFKELIAAPFIEFECTWYLYDREEEKWTMQSGEVIGYNLESGLVYEGSDY